MAFGRNYFDYPPDRHDDECDVCHQLSSQLWEDYEQPGEFLACAKCIRTIEDRRIEAETAYNQADYDRDYPVPRGWDHI